MKTRSGKARYKDASRGERLQRVLADAGVASRRACEALIEGGHVSVNGTVVRELPAWVDAREDRIVVDGVPLRVPSGRIRSIHVMLNKPQRTLTTARDEPGADRRTVADLVRHPSGTRLFPVGRLDYDTTGLLLLTNDGDLAQILTHPRYGVTRTYKAIVKGRLSDEQVDRLERGVFLADRRRGRTDGASRTSPLGIEIVRRDRERTTLNITLREGRNREVRRVLASADCRVRRLERIAMGPLRLKGLARGEWRELDRREAQALRRLARKLDGGRKS